MNYKELKELLIKANEAYYKYSKPIMSDYEFDQRLKELEKMEADQGYADPDSPTQKPGSDLTESNSENKHGRPMLSLENTYNIDEVKKWYNDMVLATGNLHPEIVVNPKWDGGSGAIRYGNDGHVTKALTRGDGEVGEDITTNVKYCDANVWGAKKNALSMPFRGEVRGELIMTDAGFETLNTTLYDGKYQNPRNLLSGSMKLLDLDTFVPRAEYIKFYAYWLEDSPFKKYSDDLEELKRNNFEVGPYYLCKSLKEVEDAINAIKDLTLDCAIDGAVLKLNDKTYWDEIGSTAKFPRWAKAYKYEQETMETRVTNITFEVGRTGKITPLCWFKPVFVDGSTIQKATLNNKDFYESMDIAVGDTVKVQKAAAIIPQIVAVTKRSSVRGIMKFPTKCPCCGTKLVKHKDDQADWYCDNIMCKSRRVDQIINYTHCIGCDGFAEIIVERMYNAGILTSIADLYRLKNKKDSAARLDRLSKNMVEKLCNNIEATKNVEFWKVLAGLGIPNVGPKTARILAKKFKSMKVIQGLTQAELEEVEDIAEITAEGIVKWFKNNNDMIKELEEFGVTMTDNTVSKEKPKIDLSGKTFCITGALSLRRNTYISLIETCGGKVVDSVSKNTTYLITNDKTTGTKKNILAKNLGIPILNERELLEMCDSLHLLKELEA